IRFFHVTAVQTCALPLSHVFEFVFQFYFFRYGNTVFGYGRCAEGFVDDNVAAFRAQGHFDCVGQDVHTLDHFLTGGVAKFHIFSCHDVCFLVNSNRLLDEDGSEKLFFLSIREESYFSMTPNTSDSVRMISSSPSILTLLPEYWPNRTWSPTFRVSGRTSPLSSTLPVPTATTSPWFGFSLAEPGSRMPPAVLASSSLRRTTT